MFKIPKQAYTAEFKELAVKRVNGGQGVVADERMRSVAVGQPRADSVQKVAVADGCTMVAWPTKPRHSRIVILGLDGTSPSK